MGRALTWLIRCGGRGRHPYRPLRTTSSGAERENRENGRLEVTGAEAIYRLLRFSAFEPEEITRMTAAYEHALRAIRLAERQDPITELVAKKIIEVARLGESDPVRIQIRALKELGVTPQSASRLHR